MTRAIKEAYLSGALQHPMTAQVTSKGSQWCCRARNVMDRESVATRLIAKTATAGGARKLCMSFLGAGHEKLYVQDALNTSDQVSTRSRFSRRPDLDVAGA